MGRIAVYSTPSCPHCRAAKTLLSVLNIDFTTYDVQAFPDLLPKMTELSQGKHTVPQIFFNGRYIGGNDSLQALHSEIGAEALVDLANQALNAPEDPLAPPPPPQVNLEETKEKEELNLVQQKRVLIANIGSTEELEALVKQIRQPAATGGLAIKAHRVRLSSYPNCFQGLELVNWLVLNQTESKTTSREEAIHLAQDMLKRSIIYPIFSSDQKQQILVDNTTLFRFVQDSEKLDKALNMSRVFEGEARHASVVAVEVRKQISQLYGEFLSSNGTEVDYKGMAASPEFEYFTLSVTELQKVDLSTLKREELIAFCINIYNALVIHATAISGPASDTFGAFSRAKWFNNTRYCIGGIFLSLNEIENGILRGNRRGPGSFQVSFAANSPMAALVVKPVDPRIHFALVCGAKSCPPIKVYSAANLEIGLSSAAQGFFQEDSNLHVNESTRTVRLSMILKWYSIDFGQNNKEVATFVSRYATGANKDSLDRLLADSDHNINLEYTPYDWTSNAKSSSSERSSSTCIMS